MSCTQQSNEQPFVRKLTTNENKPLPLGTFRQYIPDTQAGYSSGDLYFNVMDSSSKDETAKFGNQSNGTVMVVEYGTEAPRILFFSDGSSLCDKGSTLLNFWIGQGGPTTTLLPPGPPPLSSIVKFDANKNYTFRLFNSLADAQKYLGITQKKRTLEIAGIVVFVGAVILAGGGLLLLPQKQEKENGHIGSSVVMF